MLQAALATCGLHRFSFLYPWPRHCRLHLAFTPCLRCALYCRRRRRRRLRLQVFLGTLRDSEVERVNDKVGQAVIETCLAMTIFREDITASFLT